MKKIILFTLLSASLFAQSKVYMGLGYNLYNESYSTSTIEIPDASDNALRLKLGYGMRDSYAIEFSFDYIDHASYDAVPQTGTSKYAFNVEFLKAFELGIYVNPFVKVGFGAGLMSGIDNNQSSLSYGSFNFATGVFVPINEYSDIEIAYEYKNLSYEPRTNSNSTPATAHVNTLYFGYNFRF